jgi:undecaprenyl-diphosphatase
MWSWINAGVEAVAAYPDIALLIAFLGAIIEAVAILGIIIPGTPIMMAMAGAAAMSGQDMRPYLVVGVVGAVIGDVVSFYAGARYSDRLTRIWPLSRHPEMLTNARRYFDRYGMLSIAFCRFVPVLRSTVPLVAGMAGMQRGRFVIANVLSACVWAPAHIYPAQLAGLMLDTMEHGEWQAAAGWAAALAATIAAAWALHRAIQNRMR